MLLSEMLTIIKTENELERNGMVENMLPADAKTMLKYVLTALYLKDDVGVSLPLA